MKKIKCAVIGVGYLGKFHAQKYAAIPSAELVAVCDIDQEACQSVAQSLNVEAVSDYQSLIGKVDAVSIAVPTILHHTIGKSFLEAGIHVLMEKPITTTLEEARELITIAKQQGVVFQIGHLERFNPARVALNEHLKRPHFIESQRLAPFNPRGTDVNVVLDLMIHDIDIIQNIVQSPIVSIDAQGAPVLSNSADIANARIRFANDCVANVTASRISFKTERKMRIFQHNTYISIDYHNKKFAVFERGDQEMFPGIPEITRHETIFEKGDSLLLQIESFINSICTHQPPLVTGEEGYQALETAFQINQLIHQHLERAHANITETA